MLHSCGNGHCLCEWSLNSIGKNKLSDVTCHCWRPFKHAVSVLKPDLYIMNYIQVGATCTSWQPVNYTVVWNPKVSVSHSVIRQMNRTYCMYLSKRQHFLSVCVWTQAALVLGPLNTRSCYCMCVTTKNSFRIKCDGGIMENVFCMSQNRKRLTWRFFFFFKSGWMISLRR